MRVVLIGTGRHDADSVLGDVPAVEATLRDLGRVLVEACGLLPENLLVVQDPAAPEDVLLAVARAAELADEVVVVVYVGHGLLSWNGSLYLATAGTSTLHPALADHQAVRYEHLATAVGTSRAPTTVVILDCCFSGRADPPTRRGHLLVSASGEEMALAPAGEPYTAFTGTMIELLREGDPGAPPFLTLDHLYRYQWRAHRESGRPVPRRQAGDLSGALVLGPNAAYRPAQPPAPAGPVAHGADVPCPYRGFHPYLAADEGYFCGRTELTNHLVRRVAQRLWHHHPLVVTGPSGAGKTSLLHAGLLPAVGRGELGVPRSGGWPTVTMTPGKDPAGALAARIGELAGCDPAAVLEHPGRVAGRLRTEPNQPDTRLLIVVDQFEQLFTHSVDEAGRGAFIRLLAALARGDGAEPAAAVVVLGLRAEFYGHCARSPELAGALEDTVLVGPMSRTELRAAITEPAALAGLTVQQELVDLLLGDLGADRVGGYEAGRLPLLSHALQGTWGQQEDGTLTAKGYLSTGGIARAVEVSGEKTVRRFAGSQAALDCVRQVLLSMIRFNEGAPEVAQRVAVAELLGKLPDPRVGREVLDTLARARLVTLDREYAGITHEALLRSWPRLRGWIEDDRDWLHVRQRIVTDATAWKDRGRDVSLLYRGANLAAARATTRAANHEQDLGPVGREFLAEGARHARRGRLLRRASVAAGVALAVLAAGGVAYVKNKDAEAARQHAEAVSQRHTAEVRRDLNISLQLASKSEAEGNQDPASAALLSLAAWRISPTAAARQAMLHSLERPAVADLGAIGDTAEAIAFDPGGRKLVVAGDDFSTHGVAVSRWDTAVGAGTGVHETVTDRAVGCKALSRDGRFLAVALTPQGAFGGSDTVQVWDMTTGSKLLDRPADSAGRITSLALSPDGKMLAEGGPNDSVPVWNVTTGTMIRRLTTGRRGGAATAGLAFSATGVLAVAVKDENVHFLSEGPLPPVYLWNLRAPAGPPVPLGATGGPVTALAFDARGATLATADTGRGGTSTTTGGSPAVRLWNTATGRPTGRHLTAPGGAVNALAFSPDDATLAGGVEDRGMELWATATGQQSGTSLTGQQGSIRAIAFSPDGRTVASSTDVGGVRLWRPFGRRPLATLAGHHGTVDSIAFAGSGGRLVAAGGGHGRATAWDTAAAAPAKGSPVGDSDRADTVAFSHDGTTTAVGTYDGTVRLQLDGRESRDLAVNAPDVVDAEVESLAFSGDGSTLAVAITCVPGDGDGTCRAYGVQRWDTATGRRLKALDLPAGLDVSGAFAVAFAPRRPLVVAATDEGPLVRWNSVTGKATGTYFPSADRFYTSLAFGPDGTTVAAARSDSTVDVFDAASSADLTPTYSITTSSSVRSVALDPHGDVLAAGMADGAHGSIQLYGTSDVSPAGAPLVTTAPVNAVAFDPGRAILAAGLGNGTVQLWDTSYVTATADALCARVIAPFTPQEWKGEIPAGPAYRNVCPGKGTSR
ncbi:caspase, EACC1-associated type [Actinacidiphila paucisporea]|uniref:caspase, EACC1-associated type n=1 Tax=Actinacidiphila paucisporea TaxID=310782 RepID=UPI000937CACD|nr:AAA family ATPase [Actinacidiphila paucisporea]